MYFLASFGTHWQHVLPMYPVYAVDSFPEDFQQILSDLWWEKGERDLPKLITTQPRRTDLFVDQLDREVSVWNQRDFYHARLIQLAMVSGKQFPPLDYGRRKLLDGYHRLYAMVLLGRRFCNCIDLS